MNHIKTNLDILKLVVKYQENPTRIVDRIIALEMHV